MKTDVLELVANLAAAMLLWCLAVETLGPAVTHHIKWAWPWV